MGLAIAAIVLLVTSVAALAAHEHDLAIELFARDESPRLGDGETGLRRAYGNLRRKGYRVAVQPDSRANPRAEAAWWIFQPGADWFSDPEARAQEVRSFLAKGGTVVMAPDEAMTVVEADTDPVLQNEDTPPARLDRFFAALLLDVHLMAFETENELELSEEDDVPEAAGGEDDPADPDNQSGAAALQGSAQAIPVEPIGYSLPVSGRGSLFEELGEVRTSWGTYWEGDSLLMGEVRLNSDGFPLVVELPVGRGRLVLVAECTYFENEFLESADNGKLLEALARHYGGASIHLLPGRETATAP